jgi:hypothetical protein
MAEMLRNTPTANNAVVAEVPLPAVTVRSRRPVAAPSVVPQGGINPNAEDYFVRTIMSMDSSPEEVRSGSEYIHVSTLIDYCARREALAFTNRMMGVGKRTKRAMAGERIIWAMGRAVEAHVRTQFIEGTQRKGIIGSWSCKCGQQTNVGYFRKTPCSRCGDEATIYGEKTLRDDDLKIAGNPDLLYDMPNGNVRVVEIKSMAVTQFKELNSPLPFHVLQAACYQRLLEVNGHTPDPELTVFYACKDFQPKPYKEYHVVIDDALSARIDDLFELARVRAEWIESKKGGGQVSIPERLAPCSSANTTRAKGCSECISCFSHNA